MMSEKRAQAVQTVLDHYYRIPPMTETDCALFLLDEEPNDNDDDGVHNDGHPKISIELSFLAQHCRHHYRPIHYVGLPLP